MYVRTSPTTAEEGIGFWFTFELEIPNVPEPLIPSKESVIRWSLFVVSEPGIFARGGGLGAALHLRVHKHLSMCL